MIKDIRPSDAGIQRMLADIQHEVQYTKAYIGRNQLDARVMQAMASVPRHYFVPAHLQDRAYDNGPLPIGQEQTISQPYIVALMSDLLALPEQARVLEIGTGSGYQTAVLAELAEEVFSLEIIATLSEAASVRLAELGYRNIHTRVSDGHEGWPEHAPYDGIIVTAAAQDIPEALLEQLKPGARMVIPVGGRYGPQELMLLEKDANSAVTRRSLLPVAFVPLRHRPVVLNPGE